MDRLVYEYATVEINAKQYIKSWQIFPFRKRPELLRIPAPTKEMNESLQDEYGNLLYTLTVTEKDIEVEPGVFERHDVGEVKAEPQPISAEQKEAVRQQKAERVIGANAGQILAEWARSGETVEQLKARILAIDASVTIKAAVGSK